MYFARINLFSPVIGPIWTYKETEAQNDKECYPSFSW